jgi:prepilin-type N-terminal cleavage/methylation domain-containing protein
MRLARNDRGLTLIEALVSVTVFSIVAAALAALMLSGFKTADTNRYRRQAVSIAEQEVENLRSMPYNQVGSRVAVATRDGKQFSVSTGVQANVPAQNMSTVTVAVSWSDRQATRSYAVRTILTQVERR